MHYNLKEDKYRHFWGVICFFRGTPVNKIIIPRVRPSRPCWWSVLHRHPSTSTSSRRRGRPRASLPPTSPPGSFPIRAERKQDNHGRRQLKGLFINNVMALGARHHIFSDAWWGDKKLCEVIYGQPLINQRNKSHSKQMLLWFKCYDYLFFFHIERKGEGDEIILWALCMYLRSVDQCY